MFTKVIQDIREYHITGAEKITLWGVRAFSYKKAELDKTCQFISTYMINLSKVKKALVEARDNEFSLCNALDYIFDKKRYTKTHTLRDIQKDIGLRLKTVEDHLDEALIRVPSMAEKKIKNSMSITTIGNSSFVEETINKAKEKKTFKVNVFQGGPEEKGREFIEEIRNKKDIIYYPDSMIAEVLEHTDLVLLGATAITKKGECLTQTGAKSIAKIAKALNIPVYIVTDSLKYGNMNIKNEEKPKEELWLHSPKKITIHNPSTSILDQNDITAIISEKGILKPKEFLKEAKKSFF